MLEAWEKRYHVSRNNPFGLLKHVGEDVPGALQFVQPDRLAEYQRPSSVQIHWLTEAEVAERMALLRKDAAAFRLDADQGRMSLAGAQAKTALYANILNYLIGGTDTHAKNYSLLFGSNQQVRLSPLYAVSSQLPYQEKIPQRLAMKVGKYYEIASISLADWRSLARHCKLEETELVDRIREPALMLPDHIIAARDEALRQKLEERPIKEATRLMLKYVKDRQKNFGSGAEALNH